MLYRNQDGLPVAHLLVAQSRNGWSTAGLGNQDFDNESVLPENLLGIVKYAFAPVDLPPRDTQHYAAR